MFTPIIDLKSNPSLYVTTPNNSFQKFFTNHLFLTLFMKHFLAFTLLGASLLASAVAPQAPVRKGERDPYDLRNLVKPEQIKSDGERLKSAPTKKTLKQMSPRREATSSTTYKGVFESFFEYYEFYHDGGEFFTYDVDITIDGTKATIKNLFNFAANPDEACTEEEITGVYDPSLHTITIPTPKEYDKATIVGQYYGSMPIVLLAGTVDANQQMSHASQLVFNVSDDCKTISTQQDFAAMIYQSNGSPYGYKTAYMGAKMKQDYTQPDLVCFSESADFGNLYAGQQTSRFLRVFNFYNDEAMVDFSVSPDVFTVSDSQLPLYAMEMGEVEVKYCPTAPAEDYGTLTAKSGTQSIDIILFGNAVERPDFSYIVKGGDLNVCTSADQPFLRKEIDGKSVACSNNKPVNDNLSALTVDFDVPEGHIGTLKWKGYTNSTAEYGGAPKVTADDVEVINYAAVYQKYMDEELKFAPGHHTVSFQYLVRYADYYYEADDYMWISDLQLVNEPMAETRPVVLTREVKFENSIINNGEAKKYATARLRNDGSAPLTLNKIDGSEHFSGDMPRVSTINTLEVMEIPLTFTATASGSYEETITLDTSAGPLAITCKALVRDMPDFQSIVKEGNFTFTTSEAHPWLVENGVAYNSTSKELDPVLTYCTLTAEFEVPEGKLGILSFGGMVDTSPIDDITDFLSITVSGYGKYSTTIVPGQFDLDSDKYPYYDAPSAQDLTVPAGKGYISFSYVQFGDSKYFGQDLAQIKDLALTLRDAEANAALLQTETLDFPDTYEGRSNYMVAKLYNIGTDNLKVLNALGDQNFYGVVSEAEAPFQSYLEVPIYFAPTTSGEISGSVLLETTAGDFIVQCTGTALSMEGILLLEDFESDIDWYAYDRDGDGDCWDYAFNAFGGYTMGHTHTGTDCLVSFSRDNSGDFTPDNWAISPAFDVPTQGAVLKFWTAADYGDPTPLGDIFSLYAAEGIPFDGSDGKLLYDSYQELLTEELTYTDWKEHTVELDAFAGKKIHLAWRHHDSVGKYMVKLDDVRVDAKPANDAVALIPAGKVVAQKYYTLDGTEIHSIPTQGIIICKTTYENGAVKAVKIVK